MLFWYSDSFFASALFSLEVFSKFSLRFLKSSSSLSHIFLKRSVSSTKTSLADNSSSVVLILFSNSLTCACKILWSSLLLTMSVSCMLFSSLSSFCVFLCFCCSFSKPVLIRRTSSRNLALCVLARLSSVFISSISRKEKAI